MVTTDRSVVGKFFSPDKIYLKKKKKCVLPAGGVAKTAGSTSTCSSSMIAPMKIGGESAGFKFGMDSLEFSSNARSSQPSLNSRAHGIESELVEGRSFRLDGGSGNESTEFVLGLMGAAVIVLADRGTEGGVTRS